jgi:hypothetical protein
MRRLHFLGNSIADNAPKNSGHTAGRAQMLLTSTERLLRVRLKDNGFVLKQNNTKRENWLKRGLIWGDQLKYGQTKCQRMCNGGCCHQIKKAFRNWSLSPGYECKQSLVAFLSSSLIILSLRSSNPDQYNQILETFLSFKRPHCGVSIVPIKIDT